VKGAVEEIKTVIDYFGLLSVVIAGVLHLMIICKHPVMRQKKGSKSTPELFLPH
jgi:hypothetical protein